MEPFKQHLLSSVMPAITAALIQIANVQPVDPVKVSSSPLVALLHMS